MMRFINPKTDYAFKKIFGSTESQPILISFLNALIYDGHSTIEDLEIIDPNLLSQLTNEAIAQATELSLEMIEA